jgi:hypothetical protein
MRNETTVLESEQAKDRVATLRNRAQLGANKNLLFWYRELYRYQFRDFSKPTALSILEIGGAHRPENFSQTSLRVMCSLQPFPFSEKIIQESAIVTPFS